MGDQRTPEPWHAHRRQSTDIPRFREHKVMASPLDFWSLIRYFALVWIAAFVIHLAEFAYAEVNDRLPPRPFLFFAGQCLGNGVVWTIAVTANAAHERGLITFATLIVGMILVAGTTCLIVTKTHP